MGIIHANKTFVDLKGKWPRALSMVAGNGIHSVFRQHHKKMCKGVPLQKYSFSVPPLKIWRNSYFAIDKLKLVFLPKLIVILWKKCHEIELQKGK